MRIEVDMRQPWREVAYFYEKNKEAFEVLIGHVDERFKTFDFYAMSCGDLCTLLDGGVPETIRNISEALSVMDYCQLVNTVRDGLKGFTSFLEMTTPPSTPLQIRAADGMMQITIEEMILLQLKDFYTLHSLEEAQRLTVYEYMIARKADYNQRLAEYNMLRIFEQKAKR